MTDVKRLVWDLETNGLLDTVTKIHCLVIRDCTTGSVLRFADEKAERVDGSILNGLAYLASAGENGYHIGGHNTINYDHAVIEKLYPRMFKFKKSQCFDTLVMARLIWSHIKEIDAGLMNKGKLPGALFGRHSLEAWGVRLGLTKGDFGKKEKTDDTDVWAVFTQEMLNYCERDTEVTAKLLERCLAKNYSPQAITLEHDIQWVMSQMQRNGFCFNEQAAAELLGTLITHRDRLELVLQQTFANWEVALPDFIPARDNKTLGYLKGVPVPRSKVVVFNPRSRDHIANRLIALRGWVPDKESGYTDGGKPKVDEDVMKELEYPEAPLLTEYLMVSKRLGQLSEGDVSWMKLVTQQGRIHGSINPNGAVTGRATHSRPNITQVPASKSPYGSECRSLFGVPEGWLLVGADASGLELRCLAHYMARYDEGAYGEALLNGDIHTVNQKAAGLPTRDNAKTFIYGFLYGAGSAKIGQIVGGSEAEGKKLKSKFLKGLPALKHLQEAVQAKVKSDGCLRGLDGRFIHIRSSHAALNSLLQGAGAAICKTWIVQVEASLQAQGLKHGWDGDYALAAFCHDESQTACRTPEIAAIVAETCTRVITEVGEFYNFRCRLNGESKIGKTWSDTH